NVLPRYFVRRGRLHISRKDLELFHVDVNGVGPITAIVLQDPDLRRTLLRSRTNFVHVKELAVDGPASVIIAKHPPPGSHHLAQINVGEGAQRGRDLAVVGRIAVNVKAQDRRARVQQLSWWAGPILLWQAVHEEELIPDPVVGEVDDYVHAICDA